MSPSTLRQTLETQRVKSTHYSDEKVGSAKDAGTAGRGHFQDEDNRKISPAPAWDTFPRTPTFEGNPGGSGHHVPMNFTVRGGRGPEHISPFGINLIYEGRTVGHQVTTHMRVIQLALDAAAIFGLNYQDLILMLFGMIPHTLPITPHGLLSDPPTVGPGATVLVFRVGGDPARNQGGGTSHTMTGFQMRRMQHSINRQVFRPVTNYLRILS
jgi:hypothetical protein